MTTSELPTAEIPTGALLCRHLLAVRGGTLACTLPHGHPDTLHADEDLEDSDGSPVRWSCSCRPAVGVTVCLTWAGYET